MYDVAQQQEIMLDGIGDLEDVCDEAFLQEMWYSAYNCAGNGFMPEECDGFPGMPGYPFLLCMRRI